MTQEWKVEVNKDTLKTMPKPVLDKITALAKSMEISGPIQNKWLNFSKLKSNKDRNIPLSSKEGETNLCSRLDSDRKPNYNRICWNTRKRTLLTYLDEVTADYWIK